MATADARGVRCGTCAAAVPLVEDGATRCLFCLSPVAMPAELVSDLRREAVLRADVTAHLDALARARGRAGRLPLFGIVAGAVVLTIAAFAIGGFIRHLPPDVDPGAYLSIGLVLVAHAGLVAAFVGGSFFSRHRARLRLATLPASQVEVGETISARCPGCGAPLDAGADIGATCEHCGTDALLPAALVPIRLQRRHRRILALKAQRGRVARVGADRLDDANVFGGYALMAVGCVMAVGYLVWYVLTWPAGHLSILGQIAMALMPPAMLGGLFIGFGWMAVRGSRTGDPP
jgi:hypothetical protein